MTWDALPSDWRKWVLDHIEHGTADEEIVRVMIDVGRFAPDLAESAIVSGKALYARADATPVSGSGPSAPVPRLRPDPDLRGNRITLPDRCVDVLMVMTSPRIVLFGDVLSRKECRALMAIAASRISGSPVANAGRSSLRQDEYRTGSGAWFRRGESDLVARVEARIAELLRWPIDQGEGLQVCRYDVGEEYRPHYDWFDPDRPGLAEYLANGGQRVGTLILYLSNVAAGGATCFPELGLEIRPRCGEALFFAGVDAQGELDRATLHAGVPVISGTKYIATKWLRQRPYVELTTGSA